ncbi:MAG: cytochrome c biogenesis protein ResB, partial [Maribacter sp.]|nr:cytochrome c biogenesis protein ResB [Maribacter sp.]
MKNFIDKIKKYLSPLFNTRAAGLYILLFAAAIGTATFIENDFGTSAAQKVIYKSWWFELLLVLFAITIITNIFKFRMIQQKKWPLFLFHGAIIIILIGAGVTRYFGFEGIMHIRENNTANSFLSSNAFLKFKVNKNNETYDFDEPVLFASLGNNSWTEKYLIDGDLITIDVKEFIPNPKQMLTESIDGRATLQIVVSGANGREEYFISQGQTKRIRNVIYNFKNTRLPNAINIRFRNDSLQFHSDKTLTQMEMVTQRRDTLLPSGTYKSLKLKSLYSDGVNNFVLADFKKKGKIHIVSENSKVRNESLTALLLDISVNGNSKEAYVYGSRGVEGRPQQLNFDGLDMAVSYGAKEISVPFQVKLNKFIMEKYPGTNSAASYASEVTLVDDAKSVNLDYRI